MGLTRKRSNGKVENYPTMLAATVVAPGHSRVVPLFPVPGLDPGIIAPQDGAETQDCERNAGKRWPEKHGERLRPLRPVYLGDDRFACPSIAKRVTDNCDDFSFTCKASSHRALYDFIDGAEPARHAEKIRKGTTTQTRRYRWIESVPRRDGKDAILVNWIGFEIADAKGLVKYAMAFVPSLPVAKNNVAEIAACGRARWKIENEGFNVMKNHGYALEPNFGHGEKSLAMVLVGLNLLAFAWHSALDLIEPPFRAAREVGAKRRRFFAHLPTLPTYVVFPSWQVFLKSLPTFNIPKELLKTQKSNDPQQKKIYS